jgi:hypothetical protein
MRLGGLRWATWFGGSGSGSGSGSGGGGGGAGAGAEMRGLCCSTLAD